jgi:hypothetical protein
MDNPKKFAAAVTAVLAYIQEEEAAILQAGAPSTSAEPPPPRPNLWGISGRQETMQTGILMQMKAFHR